MTMGNINMVCISGNLTADCQRKKAGETPLVEFTIACNEFRKDAEQYVNFIDCTLFGKRAQGLADYLVKGQKVAISGKLHHSRWETEDGQKRSKITVTVNELEIVTPKKQDNEKDDIPW